MPKKLLLAIALALVLVGGFVRIPAPESHGGKTDRAHAKLINAYQVYVLGDDGKDPAIWIVQAPTAFEALKKAMGSVAHSRRIAPTEGSSRE